MRRRARVLTNTVTPEKAVFSDTFLTSLRVSRLLNVASNGS